MQTAALLNLLMLGALLGAVGQAIRVIVGLKKMHDETRGTEGAFGQRFDGSSMLVSLLIGAVAGVVGVLSLATDEMQLAIGREQLVTLIGIGYAGADFIEGFMRSRVPQTPLAPSLAKAPDDSPPPAVG